MKKRRLTPAEKDRRQHERKAARMNAAEAKAHGPLFAHLAPIHTAEEAEARWRLQKAGAAEMTFTSAVARNAEWIIVQWLERWLRIKTNATEADLSHMRRHSNPERIVRSWKTALTLRGQAQINVRIEQRDEWITGQYNRDGRRVFGVMWPELCKPAYLTEAEADELFPDRLYTPPIPETDDERHFEALAATLRSYADGR